MHEGKKFEEGHYYGYFRNLASLRWWKLDDEHVEEVREDVVLDDAYGGDLCIHVAICPSRFRLL